MKRALIWGSMLAGSCALACDSNDGESTRQVEVDAGADDDTNPSSDDDDVTDDDATDDDVLDDDVLDDDIADDVTDDDAPDDDTDDDDIADDVTDDDAPDDDDTVDASVPGEDPALLPCDVQAGQDSCAQGTCSGTPTSGYYCRPECDESQTEMDPCGDSGICFENRVPGDVEVPLVCVETDDCDLLTSAGCEDGEACTYLRLEPLATVCAPAGSAGPWEACDGSEGNACASGLSCLGTDLEDDETGVCTPLCAPGAEATEECALCVGLTEDFGSCAQCSVIDNDCPAGSQCHPANETLGGICVPYGPGLAGDECAYDAATSCQEGYLCMEQELDGPDANRCVQTCDSAAPQCDDIDGNTAHCIDVGALDPVFEFGELGFCLDGLPGPICAPQEGLNCADETICVQGDDPAGFCLQTCDPTQGATCPSNRACLPYSDGDVFAEPFLMANGMCVDGCMEDADCAGDGDVCLHVDGLETPGICGTACNPTETGDAGAGDCAGGFCMATPEDTNRGACIIALDSCDPSGDPCAAGTCTPVAGAASSGLCLFPCFAQSPEACLYGDTTLASCVLRDDPRLHDGVCLGQPDPCDPVDNTGCEAPQSCTVLGGAAFGGGGFQCSQPGVIGIDEVCESNEGCVAGTICVQLVSNEPRVCRPYCDLQDPSCPSGSCEDHSVNYYLPAGSVGACSGP